MRCMAREWTGSRLWRPFGGMACLVALLVILGGCSLGGGSSTSSTSAPENTLTEIPWCDAPSINFIDSSSTGQSALTDWNTVEPELGFSPYLPTSLPEGTCLVLAGGSVHDPIFGGHFVITWNLPGNIPLSFSEAPKRANLGSSLQCAQSAQQSTTSICLGTLGNTGITIAATESATELQSTFKALKSNVDWVPSGTDKLLATATPSS